MAEGIPGDELEPPAQPQRSGRTKRIRMFAVGLAATMALLVAVVVLSPLKEQYGQLDPYQSQAKTGSSVLMSDNGEAMLEQDPFQNEELVLRTDGASPEQFSSRDLAALRLLEKARYGGRALETPRQTESLWTAGMPTREMAEMRLQRKAARAEGDAPINRQHASALLEKARASLTKRGPEIQELISSAKNLDSTLHSHAVQSPEAVAKRRVKTSKSGLYFTPGGYGPYPSDTGANYLDDWSDEEAPAVSEVTDDDSNSGPPYESWTRYPEEEDGPTYFAPAAAAAIGAAVARQSPLDWFRNGAPTASPPVVVISAVNHPRPQGWDDGRDEDEGDAGDGARTASAQAPQEEEEDTAAVAGKTPVLERVNKLIDLKKQSDDIQQQQEQVMEDIYSDAENGDMARLGGSPAAKAYAQGFLQGAVEASKKSMEQQSEFEELLRRQEEVVNRLEDAVWELEEHQREENWAKTASQYPDEQPAASAPTAEPPAAATAAAEPAAAAESAPPAKKLTIGQPDASAVPFFDVDFYMEAMCPGCQHFAINVLPAVLNAFEGQMNLRAIPYGNAAIVNGTVHCQHGPDECMGNKIELCMMQKYPRWTTWFPAFKCIESSEEKPLDAAKTCLAEHGMDVDGVIGCAGSAEGDVMQLQAGNETINLKPPHQFTPWIVVNGEAVGERVMDLLAYMCEKLPLEQRGAVGACAPSKFKAVGGTQALQGRGAPKGLCYPTLRWDGTK